MISSKTVESVRTLADARKAWPAILDIGEIQEGGCPEFWKSRFPGVKPEAVLERCRAYDNWAPFWSKACPADCLMYQTGGAWLDEQRELSPGEVVSDDMIYTEPGELSAAVFRAVVEGRLDTEDPAYAKQTPNGIILYWPFRPSE